MKKIIVFGATGDTGGYFVRFFKEKYKGEKYEIIASGNRENADFEKMGVKYVRVDIKNKSEFERLPKDVYAVVDFAGLMPARMKGYDPYKYIDINITGTLNILEFCRENGVDRILYMQSFGDIKNHAEKNPLLTVDMQPNFSYNTDHTVYVMTKNFGVDLIKNYHEMYGLKFFVFRLPTIYLISENDKFYVDGKIRKIGYRELIDKARKGEDIEIWGDPKRVKDMIYVKDFCRMLYAALFVNNDKGHYNVGTGKGISLQKQIEGIVEVFAEKRKSKISFNPEKPNAPQYIMDISEAKKDLGYNPEYDYIKMLKDMKKELNERNL